MIGALTAGLLLKAGSSAIATIGFTSTGIAASSLAAATQAVIGDVAAGSAFALAQSAGATGAIATAGTVGGVVVLTYVTFYGAKKLYDWKIKPKL